MGAKMLILLSLSALACASAVDPQLLANRQVNACYWDGTSPFCAGGCSGGYTDCGTSSCGDGACCVTGYKKYCCRGQCPNAQVLEELGVGNITRFPEIAAPKPEVEDGDENAPANNNE